MALQIIALLAFLHAVYGLLPILLRKPHILVAVRNAFARGLCRSPLDAVVSRFCLRLHIRYCAAAEVVLQLALGMAVGVRHARWEELGFVRVAAEASATLILCYIVIAFYLIPSCAIGVKERIVSVLANATEGRTSTPKLIRRSGGIQDMRLYVLLPLVFVSYFAYVLVETRQWLPLLLFAAALIATCHFVRPRLRAWAERRERILDWYGNRLARKYSKSQGDS